MRDQDFPGVRWNGHWVAPNVPEFEIDPTSVGSDLRPCELLLAAGRLQRGDGPRCAARA